MQRLMPHTSMTIHKHNTWQGNNRSCQTCSKVHVCNGQRRWFHGTADCVAACAHKAPRSQTRITSTMTERRHSRAKSKRRLGTASGTGLLWLAPQKSTSHTQLGTYGPGYFIVPRPSSIGEQPPSSQASSSRGKHCVLCCRRGCLFDSLLLLVPLFSCPRTI